MNTIIRNSLLAFAIVGALSLTACKTTDDSMDAPEPASAPADTTTPPTDSTMPTDPTTMPPEDPTQDEPAPTTP